MDLVASLALLSFLVWAFCTVVVLLVYFVKYPEFWRELKKQIKKRHGTLSINPSFLMIDYQKFSMSFLKKKNENLLYWLSILGLTSLVLTTIFLASLILVKYI